MAATTVATELGVKEGQEWLTGLKNAVADRAQQCNADPDTYQWAAEFLTDLTTPSASEEDIRHAFEERMDALLAEGHAKPAESCKDVGDGTSSRETRPIRGKSRLSNAARFFVTFLAVCHYVLVAAAGCDVALAVGPDNDGWVMWLFAAVLLSMHHIFAVIASGKLVPITRFAHLLGIFPISMSTMWCLAPRLPGPWLPWPLWLVSFSVGFCSLAYAHRIGFGRSQAEAAVHGSSPVN